MFKDITEIKRANKTRGHFFFSPGTMRFFDSVVHAAVYAGCYFITSEKPPHGPRHFTVRKALPNGEIETVSEFGQFHSLSEAKGFIKENFLKGEQA